MKDVAAEAGVAAMTVSYTFNHPSRVAEATRTRVLEAAARLGYRRPDATARALRSGRTGQIGVVIGEHLSYAFDDPQAAQFLAGVADVCVDAGVGMVLIPTHGHPVRADAAEQAGHEVAAGDVDRVLAAAVDGYVLWTTTIDDPILAAVASSGLPASIQGGPHHPGITCISPDDRAAAAAVATAALAAAASSTTRPVPVVLSFPLDHDRQPALLHGRHLAADLAAIRFPVTAHRLAGYRDALTANGYRWDETLIAVAARNHRAHGQHAIRALLKQASQWPPLLVLAMSDELALGALDVLHPTGHTVRAAGWDATPAGRAAGITSVTNPLRHQGRLCARAILDTPPSTDDGIVWEVVKPAR
ncbi:LacI family DNA-binding transcriptional regulator [Micromonospora sp. LOL_025]|uniref:LacI family DNA-binding transcriptional regulator n=1 Tax=Micromonospora sp. LOL_025 TaxID=3345413 RepID=UPI003A8B7F52